MSVLKYCRPTKSLCIAEIRMTLKMRQCVTALVDNVLVYSLTEPQRLVGVCGNIFFKLERGTVEL